MSSVSAAPGAGCGLTPPLARRIHSADVEGETILSALYRLAHANQLCLGVVLTDPSLLQPLARRHFEKISVEPLLRAIIPRGYRIRQEGRVVIIEPYGAGPAWLSQRISRFTLRAPDTVRSTVVASLDMAFEMARNPKRSLGFVGDVHGVDFTNMIGPLDERNKTIRELFNLIAERSRGAAWVALKTPKWEFVEYQWTESQGVAQLRWISDLGR